MKMSSLVAYDDSESEDESFHQEELDTYTPAQTNSCEQEAAKTIVFKESVTFASDRTVSQSERSSSSPRFYPQTQSCADWERKSCSGSSAPLHLPATQGSIAPLQPPSCIPRSFSDGSNPARRLPAVLPGVRPYVPKRKRLSVETMNQEHPSEPVQGDESRNSQILSDAPPRLKDHLGEKPRAAGIPRKVHMSLGGHQGPVNTVQWCPVPHLSHLLLSASMDKTFKVTTVTAKLTCVVKMITPEKLCGAVGLNSI